MKIGIVVFVIFLAVFSFILITLLSSLGVFKSEREKAEEEYTRSVLVQEILQKTEEMIFVTAKPPFRIDKYEVTVAQYGTCVDAGGCQTPHQSIRCNWGQWEKARKKEAAFNDDHPINCVNWSQADAYCRWAGKRLPTVAEWETAAIGASGRKYIWGDQKLGASGKPPVNVRDATWHEWEYDSEYSRSDNYAHLRGYEDGWPYTAPVGSFPSGASSVGALDMAGNVREWVTDTYESPEGPARLTRGSSWYDYKEDKLHSFTSFYYADLATQNATVGFRCVQDM